MASALNDLNQINRFAVQPELLVRIGRAEPGLQCHVTQIFEGENPEVAGLTENLWNRHRHLGKQSRDVHEGQRGGLERRRVDRQHVRRTVRRHHAKIPAV